MYNLVVPRMRTATSGAAPGDKDMERILALQGDLEQEIHLSGYFLLHQTDRDNSTHLSGLIRIKQIMHIHH